MLSQRNRSGANRSLRPIPKTPTGVEGLDQVTGGGLQTGRTALVNQQAGEEAERLARRQEAERKRRALQRKRATIEAQIASLRSGLVAEEDDLKTLLVDEQTRAEEGRRGRSEVERHRQGTVVVVGRRAAHRTSNGSPDGISGAPQKRIEP